MSGLELQMRPGQAFDPGTSMYPLSLDQRAAQAEYLSQAKAQLELKLKSINGFYASPHAERHNGPPNCERCNTKKRRIAEAYCDFYLSYAPWNSNRPDLKDELDRRFNDPSGPQLGGMHEVFQTVLRDHIKNDLCAPKPYDDPDTYAYKSMTSDMFDDDSSAKEILDYYLDCQLNFADPNIKDFIYAMQDARTPEQRAQAYINYYCKPLPADTPQVKNFKAKYARMFEQLTPHDIVVATMRKEAEDSQHSKVSTLRHRLGELQMAQSAHLKNKARKAEKDQRMQEREPSPRYVNCSLENCPLDINITTDEITECLICDWLERKGGRRGHFYYCSVEHAEEDFDDHERHEHQCSMGSRCLYYPDIGPPGEGRQDGTELCGVCYDCEDHDLVSYFCSEECYRTNLEIHREEIHYGRDIPNTAQHLDGFVPAMDLEILN
ncbi:hypothetical protein G7Y89_g5907 [Cudoniella acicularis]|uniref:Uncharacterized protein n=1 Tax=Cudoniella acicularis TaxID=354080 RepID=A0A8H4RMZ4_9HELO|nr:hypothetical protein G7Y89_g5907 [Cudoniella acicularis]